MDTPENHSRVVLAKDGAWHEPELIRRGYSLSRLVKARTGFDILAWRDRFGGWHYPKWQFDADGAVIPEVIQILRLFRSRDTLYVMSQFLFRDSRNKPLIDLIRSVKFDPKAKEWVAAKGYDPVFGARPLKRFLQRNVETKLEGSLIAGEVSEGADISFTVENDELTSVRGTAAAKL